MSKPNRKIVLPSGEIIYDSRAMAVTAIVVILMEVDGIVEPCILAGKRSDNCPDYQGYWNIPCGYLDWDETTKEAASRELMEELSYSIDSSEWKVFGVNDDPNDSNNQNVTFRFIKVENYCHTPTPEIDLNSYDRDEVSDMAIIPLKDVDNYQWAFNHRTLLSEIESYIYS